MSVARTGVFVDSYLEFSNSLPGDLRRLLSTMRELDERSHAMLHQTREQTKYCLSLLSQCSSKATAEHKEMVEKLKKEVTAGQDQTISLCTEKVLLAQQAYELIDSHMKRLDEDLSQFADDLKQEGKIAHDEPAILPLTSIREERRRSYHFTSQLRRLDLRVERDCERDRDRDFELMPPPDGHRRAVPSYAEVEKLTEPNSPTYCICNQVSFGDMIACDNPNCEGGEWFHYVCVGLTPETRFKGKWFCPTCKELRQRDIEQQLRQKDIEPTG